MFARLCDFPFGLRRPFEITFLLIGFKAHLY
jgi:hypothetical protein